MESFQVVNLCHRINSWLLKAMKTAYSGPTDILLNTTCRLCSQDFFPLPALRLHNSCPSWDEKLNLWICAFQNAILRGHMHVAVTQMGPEAPLSFRDQPTNHWQHPGHCLLCAEDRQVLHPGQTQQCQDSTRLAAHGQLRVPGRDSCSGWAVWDAKGHAFQTIPNSMCCSQPRLPQAKTLRGVSWWHMKNKTSTTSRNCLVNHQVQAPVPTAWNALRLMGIFQSTRNNHCQCPGCSARSVLHTKNLLT